MSWNLEFKRVMLWHCPFLCGDFFKICLVHAFIFCGANAQKHNEHYNTRGTMLRARDARLSALSLLCSVFKYLCFCALFETRCENTESYYIRGSKHVFSRSISLPTLKSANVSPYNLPGFRNTFLLLVSTWSR